MCFIQSGDNTNVLLTCFLTCAAQMMEALNMIKMLNRHMVTFMKPVGEASEQ